MTDQTEQVNPKTGVYDLRCVESKEGTTQNDNKQFIQIYEICNHANAALNGRQSRFWQVLTPKGLPYVNLHRRALGLPEATADELPTLQASQYEGLVGKALLKVEIKPEVDEEGNKIVDPFSGKPVSKVYTNIDQWFAPPKAS